MNSKYYKPIAFLRQCSLMKRRVALPFILLKSGFWKSESYYPELQQKSRFRIFCELLGHIFKYGSIEYHYFSYGFDIKGFRNQNEYIDDNWFLWKANMLNTVLPKWDYTCILRDKALFAEMLTLWGFKTPQIVCNSKNALLQMIDNQVFSVEVFCKPYDGQCGGGIFKLVVRDGKCYIDGVETQMEDAKKFINEKFEKEHYLVQTLVEQHPVLNAIYEKSVNTLRLITLYDRKSDMVIPFSAVLRIGANGNTVDNWAKGGLAVGVDLNSGKLNKFGYYKHGCGQKTSKHPNSHVSFEGVILPDFEKAVENAKSLHYRLKGIAIIGWDIAFTPDGPMFIEGNDNMEVSINQEVNGGLKKGFDKIFG